MKKLHLKIMFIISFITFLFGTNAVLAVGDDVCKGSVISFKGTYYQQDAIYPGGHSESYSISMTTMSFEYDGAINGTLNDNGEETMAVDLTEVTTPGDWLAHHPITDELLLPHELLFLSNSDNITLLKNQLQAIADGDDDWDFSYSGLEWTLEGTGLDADENTWTYTATIEYDYDMVLNNLQEVYILISGDLSATKQYTWVLQGITPGAGCQSAGGGGGGSESDSASLGLGGYGSLVYLGALLAIGGLIYSRQKKHN
ncbi:MAG: hypothetical protein GF364_18055 [Candidatus Lokiarchaeota archaeon]|nr:hypothetical protein [Candidatus Lokiarchaeota archaeon]